MREVNSLKRYKRTDTTKWCLLFTIVDDMVTNVDVLLSGDDNRENHAKILLVRSVKKAWVENDCLYAIDRDSYIVTYSDYTKRLHPISEHITPENYQEYMCSKKLNELWETIK